MTEPKKCIDCGREKPITEFYTNGILNGKERHRPECKQCHILRVMKDYKRKPPLEKKCIYCGDNIRHMYRRKGGDVCSKKECRQKYCHDYYEKIKKEVFDFLGGKCSNPDCPIPPDKMDIRCLQIDHVHGNGLKDFKNSRGVGAAYLLYVLEKIKAGSKDYQILCVYCNWVKRYDNKEYGCRV